MLLRSLLRPAKVGFDLVHLSASDLGCSKAIVIEYDVELGNCLLIVLYGAELFTPFVVNAGNVIRGRSTFTCQLKFVDGRLPLLLSLPVVRLQTVNGRLLCETCETGHQKKEHSDTRAYKPFQL